MKNGGVSNTPKNNCLYGLQPPITSLVPTHGLGSTYGVLEDKQLNCRSNYPIHRYKYRYRHRCRCRRINRYVYLSDRLNERKGRSSTTSYLGPYTLSVVNINVLSLLFSSVQTFPSSFLVSPVLLISAFYFSLPRPNCKVKVRLQSNVNMGHKKF